MEVVYGVVALLFGIVVADIINESLEKVPLIFVQIMVGILLSFLPFFHTFKFSAELFMLVIIKPLIFYEAQMISFDELKKHFKPIMSLSVVLVVVSVAAISLLVKLLVPRIPLAITFMMVSILVPTNVSVIKSLKERLKFPKGVFHVLEQESLFNDSIAMIMFEMAVATNLNNAFSLSEAIAEFFISILGGVLVGTILGFGIIKIRYNIAKNNFENPSMMVVIQIITPFIVYIISEHYLHVSGIIAVIMAGMLHGIERPILNLKSTKLQVISNSTWEVIGYVLDGFVAMILGIILPSVIRTVATYNFVSFVSMVCIAFFIYAALVGLRFIWVTMHQGKFMVHYEEGRNIKQSVIYALGGVRGTISLAIALLIPRVNTRSNLLWYRNELIFIATLVILISITVPVIVFPSLLDSKDNEEGDLTYNEVRKAMLHHTINELAARNKGKLNAGMVQVTKILKGQLSFLEKEEMDRADHDKVMKLFEQTKQVELNTLKRLVQEGKITTEIAWFYKAYMTNVTKLSFQSLILNIKIMLIKRKINKRAKSELDYKVQFVKKLSEVQEKICEEVILYLNGLLNTENYEEVTFVMNYYGRKLEKELMGVEKDNMDEAAKKYLLRAFQIQNTFVDDYLEKGLISPTLAVDLKEQISYDELIYIKNI